MQLIRSEPVRALLILILTCLFSFNSAYSVSENLPHAEALIPNRLSRAQPSRFKTLTQCIKRNIAFIAESCLIAGGTCAVFYETYSHKKEEGRSEGEAFSSGCTDAIKKVIIPMVCLPTLRFLNSQLQKTELGSRLSQRRIDVHKVLAGSFMIAATTHTLCSIVANPHVLKSYEAKTGAAMWLGIIFPLVGSYAMKDRWLKEVSYAKKFLRPHQIGFVIFSAAYAFHEHKLKLLPWSAIPLGEIAIDRLLEYWFLTHYTLITEVHIQGDKIILTVAQPEKMNAKPGQFVQLKIVDDYHPFTVAQLSEKSLTFVISPVGPETREFLNLIEDGKIKNGSAISIKGPFCSALQNVPDDLPLIFISSGSGVSVSCSLLQKIAENKEHATQVLSIVHSERNAQAFNFLLDVVGAARNQGLSLASIHLFLTDKQATEANITDLQEMVEKHQLNFREVTEYEIDDLESVSRPQQSEEGIVSVFLHKGRLNLSEQGEDESALVQELLQDANAHVVISGNAQLRAHVAQFCAQNSLQYTQESFQP